MINFNNDYMASDLHTILTVGYRGVVSKLAEYTGLKPPTVYDVLRGRIKVCLPFLHAAVICTDGDARIRKYLEPEGWSLTKTSKAEPDKDTLFEECLEDIQVITNLHKKLIMLEAQRKITDADWAEIEGIKYLLFTEIEEDIEKLRRVKKDYRRGSDSKKNT